MEGIDLACQAMGETFDEMVRGGMEDLLYQGDLAMRYPLADVAFRSGEGRSQVDGEGERRDRRSCI